MALAVVVYSLKMPKSRLHTLSSSNKLVIGHRHLPLPYCTMTCTSSKAIIVLNVLKLITFLKKKFGGHKSFLCGHWYPCFGLLQSGQLYSHLAEVYMIPLRFTSGATPANLLAASMAASHFPTCMFQQKQDAGFNRETSHIAVRRANHSATATGE